MFIDIIYCVDGELAQLARALALHARGQGFESLILHHFFYFGKWLNLVEHLVWDQGVAGSNPVFPTIIRIKTTLCSFFYSSLVLFVFYFFVEQLPEILKNTPYVLLFYNIIK